MAAALMLFVLAGCAGGFSLSGLGGAPVPALALRGGVVNAVGPEGYCVAPAVSRAFDGFAVLAGCDVMAGGPSRPDINALITLQVGDAATASVAGSEPLFRSFLETDQGRALLSRSGKAETVTVRAVGGQVGQITVVFDDVSPMPVAGFQAREWRSFIDMSGRLVTLSVRGLAGDPLSDRQARALLGQAVAALRAANTATSAKAAATNDR